MIIRHACFKLSILLILISTISGCSGARYGNIKRGETKALAKTTVEVKDKVEVEDAPGFEIKQGGVNAAYGSVSCNVNKDKVPPGKVIHKKKVPHLPLLFSPITTPSDSILINIKQETKKAEDYGMLGFILGIVSVVLYPAALVGLIFSFLAYSKMKNYGLEVNNRNQIITGLILNIVMSALFILFIGFYILLFMYI